MIAAFGTTQVASMSTLSASPVSARLPTSPYFVFPMGSSRFASMSPYTCEASATSLFHCPSCQRTEDIWIARCMKRRKGRYPPGQSVDVVGAFKHRWKLDDETVRRLRELNHRDLRHVMTEYDGERSIEDVLGEVSIEMPDEDDMKTVDGAPQQPGVLTMGRLNRLELIDPTADAFIAGDANLTFAELLAKHREGLGHVGRVVATTFESIEICRERYKEIDTTIKTIEDLNGEVLHDVDCTRLAVDPRFKGMTGKFGAVYYNFPHAGVVGGFFDGHPFVRWRHENLMHLFFSALRVFVKPGGVVKVASNANATGVRFSDIMMAAEMNEFTHVETVPFLEWQLRGYLRSYGDRRDANRRPGDGENYRSQRAHSDMVSRLPALGTG
ncbi:unnamed protein product [Prorocentrum cordatum]|uniref:25S rRNA (uridine-N(3))-methyltransferase BMT5-like domain-containing protein n=1 Tax=Prorocentrum cordatum TaxID=2364126 RepID=A0ABN9WJQ8_9DINO|nr:unnamed protein product [Polarella glacialis]